MAIVEVKVPQLSNRWPRPRCRLAWKKQPGEAVAMDEILVEIETDKVVLEVPAPTDGDGATRQAGRRQLRQRGSDRSIDTEGKASAAARPPRRLLLRLRWQRPPRSMGGSKRPSRCRPAKLMADNALAADVSPAPARTGRVTRATRWVRSRPAAGGAATVPAGPRPPTPARAPPQPSGAADGQPATALSSACR